MSPVDKYSLSQYKDHIAIKITVYGGFLLDVLQSLIITIRNYYLFCSGWGQQSALVDVNWTYNAISPVTGIGEYLLLI